MSYPEPRYHGETGEASAAYRPTDHHPELTYPNGNTAHYLATGASTGGLFGLYRWEMGPEPSGHQFDEGTPVGGNYDAAAPGATVGPPAPPRDDRGDIGDLFNAFAF